MAKSKLVLIAMDELAQNMFLVADKMERDAEQFTESKEVRKHAVELRTAAAVLNTWIEGMEK